MTPTSSRPLSRDELEALVHEYRHLLEEHRRAHASGRVRRRLKTRLREVELRFEHLVDGWLSDEQVRRDWRAHLYGDAPEPAQPTRERPLVFRGRAGTGSIVEIRRRADGDCDVEVDGQLVERLEGAFDVPGEHAPGTFTLDGRVYHELFGASAQALAALADFVAEREEHPPWRFAPELAADGLADRNFGLTPRGRRAVEPILRG